ncbi:MAB_1171c family putative transporter [Streptomyces cinnamoneus]|uniref:MAB_1171c family putative transporter n=1 Tax=Streptomyces cinnamoneus TaxID=53446 RepID=UPI0033E443D7
MTDPKAVVFPACAILCALAFLYKVRDVRRQRNDPALRALLVAFSCKGVSFTLSTPLVALKVDDALGVRDLGALGIHLFGGVASSAAFLTAIVYWVYPREEARRRALVRLMAATTVAVVMVGLWIAAKHGSQQRSAHYLLQNAHRPVVATYLLLYVSAFGSGMIEIIRLCLRYGRVAGRQWLRRGLHTTAIGASACLVYCLNRLLALITVQCGLDPLEWELLTPITNGTGIFFLVAGLTMPSWGPRVSDGRRLARNFITYQRLYPLWRALSTAIPSITLNPEPANRLARLLPGDINFRLYRRVIEIQDGLLALRPYMDPDVIATARQSGHEAGLSGDGLRARVQAVALAAALRAQRDDRQQPDGKPAPLGPDTTEDGYAGEVAWLLRVARAYTALPSAETTGTTETTERTIR